MSSSCASPPTTTTESVVEVSKSRNLNIVVHKSTPSPDTLVFFSHGGGGRAEQFADQAKYLTQKKNCWCITYDWLGHGKSAKPTNEKDYQFQKIFSDFSIIFDKYVGEAFTTGSESERQVFLVGHSLGGSLMLQFLLHNLSSTQENLCKKYVKKVVFLAPAFSTVLAPAASTMLSLSPVFFLEWTRSLFSQSFTEKAYHKETDRKIVEREQGISSKNPFYVMKPLLLNWNFSINEQSLKRLTSVPSLVVTGETDGVTTFESIEAIAKLLPNSKMATVKKTGHNMMVERPQEVAVILDEFLFAL